MAANRYNGNCLLIWADASTRVGQLLWQAGAATDGLGQGHQAAALQLQPSRHSRRFSLRQMSHRGGSRWVGEAAPGYMQGSHLSSQHWRQVTCQIELLLSS